VMRAKRPIAQRIVRFMEPLESLVFDAIK
jgi:hypothetical protein